MPQPPHPRRTPPEPRTRPWWPTPGVTVLPWGSPAAQRPPVIRFAALTAECGCPADCPRDHENE